MLPEQILTVFIVPRFFHKSNVKSLRSVFRRRETKVERTLYSTITNPNKRSKSLFVGWDRGVRTSRLPPFFAFLPSPSKLEGFKTRISHISHKSVPGRTIRRPFIIHFFFTIFQIFILINVNIIDRFCTLS